MLGRHIINLCTVALLAAAGSSVRADILIAAVGPMSVTPMTGTLAMFGEALTRGAEMAVRDANAAGGVNGHQLTLRIADDACDPELAVAVANELARQGAVFINGHFCSGASLTASKVYHQHGILMITPASIVAQLTEQGFGNIFRTCGRDDAQAEFAADYAVERGLASRVAIVHDGSAFGKGIADQFKKRLNRRGTEEAIYAPIAQGDRDFSSLIRRLRDAAVSLVYLGTYHTEAGLLVRQARGHGLSATIMVNSAMVNREFWELAGPDGQGTLMTFAPDPRRLPSAAAVVERFAREGYSPEGYTLYSYAAIQVFAAAARRAGTTELGKLQAALHEGPFDTVLGPLAYDAKGDVLGFRYKMYRWNAGTYEEICCTAEGG